MHCTVVFKGIVFPWVVVTVVRGEHHVVLEIERITGITRVSGYPQGVVVCLAEYDEQYVLGIVPGTVCCMQVEYQLVAAALCQLTEQVVAEPVVATRVVKSDFKLRPRTIEEVGPMDILLDQQRNAVCCTAYSHSVINRSIKQTLSEEMRSVLIFKDFKTDENNLLQLIIKTDFRTTQNRLVCANFASSNTCSLRPSLILT